MPVFYGSQVDSALMLGTAQYPSPAIMAEAFRASGPTNRFLGKQADRQEADHVRLF